MPSYGNRQKTYSKSLGKWVDKKVDKAFDYNTLDMKSVALLVSFFRWYPDYFLDCIRSENAQYALEFPQRLILRVTARYKDTYDTASRGTTKSYLFLLGKMVKGVLYPRHYRSHARTGTKASRVNHIASLSPNRTRLSAIGFVVERQARYRRNVSRPQPRSRYNANKRLFCLYWTARTNPPQIAILSKNDPIRRNC